MLAAIIGDQRACHGAVPLQKLRELEQPNSKHDLAALVDGSDLGSTRHRCRRSILAGFAPASADLIVVHPVGQVVQHAMQGIAGARHLLTKVDLRRCQRLALQQRRRNGRYRRRVTGGRLLGSTAHEDVGGGSNHRWQRRCQRHAPSIRRPASLVTASAAAVPAKPPPERIVSGAPCRSQCRRRLQERGKLRPNTSSAVNQRGHSVTRFELHSISAADCRCVPPTS